MTRVKMRPHIVHLLALLSFSLLIGIDVQAAPVPDDLVLADATACRKPHLSPPPPVKESYERYKFQRRYIDLDGSGACVLMDFWVERLSGSDSPGMRTLNHRFLRAVGKRWVPFNPSLRLPPFLLRSPGTGEAYLVVAPDKDIDMIAGAISPEAYVRGGWLADDPTSMYSYSLLPVSEGKSRIFRALAAQLAQGTPADEQTSAERHRIRSLLFEAAELDERIPPPPHH